MAASDELIGYLCDELSDIYVAPDKEYARFVISGKAAIYPIRCWARNSAAQMQVTMPLLIPEGARSDVAEAICRINYAQLFGSFELDFRDGELRFVISTFLEDDRMPLSTWRSMMGAAMSTVERFTPVFCSMVYGNESPKEALSAVGLCEESE